MSFFSPSSLNQLEEWISHLQLRPEETKDMLFFNIVWPGGTFFMIPRQRALKRMEEEIESELAKLRRIPKYAELIDSMKILWIADIDRRLHRHLNREAGPFSALLMDPTLNILGEYQGFSKIQLLHLRSRLLQQP